MTQEEKDYKLDDFTLNNQFIFLLTKSKCYDINLATINEEYAKLRLTQNHATTMQILKKRMFDYGKKND